MQLQIPANTFVSAVFFDVPFDFLWEHLTNPMNFPEIHPHWTSKVESKGDGEFYGVAPQGDAFTIIPYTSKEQGVIDFKIVDEAGNVEWSRSRVFPLKTGGCMSVHLAVRWEGIDDDFWEKFKKGTSEDFAIAKSILEQRFQAAV